MSINKIEFPEMKTNADIETPEMFSGLSAHNSQLKVPTMVTIKEASKKTRLTYNAIRKMCINNEIIFIRVGSKFMINLDRLIEKLNGND